MFTLFYTGCFFDNISLLAEMMFAETWLEAVDLGIMGIVGIVGIVRTL